MSATAIVKVHLEIKISSNWGDDCTLAQVKKQAMDEADSVLRAAIKQNSNIKATGKVECVAINHSS